MLVERRKQSDNVICSYTWILEKEIVMDMVNSPSRLEPGVDFWIRLLNAPSDIFESCLFKIHIAGRKQEQSSSTSALYTKYKVQNMKDALLDFGLGIAHLSLDGQWIIANKPYDRSSI
jgi:hypothetical protein